MSEERVLPDYARERRQFEQYLATKDTSGLFVEFAEEAVTIEGLAEGYKAEVFVNVCKKRGQMGALNFAERVVNRMVADERSSSDEKVTGDIEARKRLYHEDSATYDALATFDRQAYRTALTRLETQIDQAKAELEARGGYSRRLPRMSSI